MSIHIQRESMSAAHVSFISTFFSYRKPGDCPRGLKVGGHPEGGVNQSQATIAHTYTPIHTVRCRDASQPTALELVEETGVTLEKTPEAWDKHANIATCINGEGGNLTP